MDALTSRKLTEISALNVKVTIFKKINILFIAHFCLVNAVSVLILY